MMSWLRTREFARALLLFLALLTTAFAIIGPLAVISSVVTSSSLALIQLATVAIALYMPPSRRDEARRKMQAATRQYVILRS